jgi:hypothetical protein
MIIAGVVVIYLACWIWTLGCLMADLQGRFPEMADNYYCEDLAVTCGISMSPPMWLLAPFMTGFYEYGWSLSRSKEDL